jgi:hypothetical protein
MEMPIRLPSGDQNTPADQLPVHFDANVEITVKVAFSESTPLKLGQWVEVLMEGM